MSSLTLRHPEEGTLIQFLDGELGRRQWRSVQKHLEACWECRTSLEELQATVNDCVRYRKHVLIPAMPAPPQPWGALDFSAIDAEFAGESFTAKLRSWLSPWQSGPLRWALSGAMALALIWIAVFRETPHAEAAALLRKAVEISASRPQTVRTLQVLSSRGPLTRTTAVSLHPGPAELEIARWFAAARYDWSDPLSAKAYSRWRDALAAKVDEVSTADPAVYSIKTTTTDSELVSATLKLRKTDFAPLSGRFEFRNHEWVELSESVDQHEIPASTVAGATGGMPRQPGMPPDPSPSPAVDETPEVPAPNEELQVIAALHQVGADLGDPLEINREGSQVVVSGAGISPARQQQIHNQLDRLPHVVVRFTDPSLPASTPAQGEPAPTRDAAATVEKSPYQARIEQRLGGRPQFERFSGQLLDWTDSMMSRAYALRRLSQQFTAVSESSLRAQDRRTLHALGREHLTALQGDLTKVQTTLNPVLTGIGATVAVPRDVRSAAAWQVSTEQMMASAHRVESLLAVVLGVAPGAPSGDAPSELFSALAQLTSDVEQCKRLLSYD